MIRAHVPVETLLAERGEEPGNDFVLLAGAEMLE